MPGTPFVESMLEMPFFQRTVWIRVLNRNKSIKFREYTKTQRRKQKITCNQG
jgi:hypothetical protein